jgi:hypothetical protein
LAKIVTTKAELYRRSLYVQEFLYVEQTYRCVRSFYLIAPCLGLRKKHRKGEATDKKFIFYAERSERKEEKEKVKAEDSSKVFGRISSLAVFCVRE